MSIQNRVLKSICLLFGMVALSASSLVAAEEGFIEDVNEAVELAQKENKDLLLLFTGSDWCPPCKKLEAEVFSEQDFMTEVSEHYVLVKFDFLKNTPLDEATSQRNDQWSKKFGIGSFPTIVLTDSELKPFAFAGYETGGFQNYLGLLEEARQLRVNRDEKLQAADAATGEFRAKLLDESISEMRREIIDVYYADVIAEIVELDKDNSLGLREKWNEARDAELRKVILTDILLLSRLEKPENAIQFIDEVLEEISFNNIEKLEIYQIKLNLVRQLDQNKLIDEVLDTMISLEGISGETRHRLIAKKAFLMVGSNRLPEAMKLLDQTILKEPDGLYLYLAKGELFQTQNKFQDAIKIFDLGLRNARTNPDVMAELVSAKADAQFSMGNQQGSLETLDDFSDDQQIPQDLRSEAMLHKAMIMRDMGRQRQARLAENRAILILESPKERAEMQKIVDRMRENAEK